MEWTCLRSAPVGMEGESKPPGSFHRGRGVLGHALVAGLRNGSGVPQEARSDGDDGHP